MSRKVGKGSNRRNVRSAATSGFATGFLDNSRPVSQSGARKGGMPVESDDDDDDLPPLVGEDDDYSSGSVPELVSNSDSDSDDEKFLPPAPARNRFEEDRLRKAEQEQRRLEEERKRLEEEQKRLDTLKKKEELEMRMKEELRRKEEDRRKLELLRSWSASLIQSRYRGHFVRTIYAPEIALRVESRRAFYSRWGATHHVVTSKACSNKAPKAFSWSDQKVRYDMVVCADETEGVGGLREFREITEKVAFEKPSVTEINDEYFDSDPLEEEVKPENERREEKYLVLASVDNIEISNPVNKWLDAADSKYRQMFLRRIEELARGHRSYAYSKRLIGCSHPLFEAKLDAGMRIMWTELHRQGEAPSIMIWFVSKHDKVPHYVKLMNMYFSRQKTARDAAVGIEGDAISLGEHTCLLDPIGNSPMKIYMASRDDLATIGISNRKLPLRLSSHEKRVNSHEGTVLLLGRSGTGKTVCLCNRMTQDRIHLKSSHGRNVITQLFVCRSRRLRDNVSRYQQEYCYAGTGDDMMSADFLTINSFIAQHMASAVFGNRGRLRFEKVKEVDFRRFKEEFYHDIRPKKGQVLDPLVVWTQIRSFIKGSVETVMHALGRGEPRPESWEFGNDPWVHKEQYMNFSSGRCRLTMEQRIAAYDMFLHYQHELHRRGLWDEGDRIMDLIRGSQLNGTLNYSGRDGPYDKVYVDEIQDSTQAEILLFFLAAGMNYQALFLAGDPAQSVVEGVDFRFEEVRQLVYLISGKTARLDKLEKLQVNYRSHAGVISCAAGVLELLFSIFPDSAKVLPKDQGLCNGPRPVYIRDFDHENSKLRHILLTDPKMVVLTRDEYFVGEFEDTLSSEHGMADIIPSSTLKLSIRNAKGMEFSDVLLVNFFCVLSTEEQSWWKRTLDRTANSVEETQFPQMETQLKLLYTAITRCCNRLVFVETKQSRAGDAFFRWLKHNDLAEEYVQPSQDADAVTGLMNNDEWRARGIERVMAGDGSIPLLRNAVSCFTCAGDKDLLARAQLLLDIELFKNRMSNLLNVTNTFDDKTEATVADMIKRCVEKNMFVDASDMCELVCPHIDNNHQRLIFQKEVYDVVKYLASQH